MRVMLISFAALVASTAVASAEAFTFTGTGQVTNEITAPGLSGRSVTTTFTTIANETTVVGGARSTVSGTCAMWRARRGHGASTNGFCLLSDAEGAYSAAFTCASPEPQSALADCSGQLTGSGGRYQGKSGTISWQRTLGSDRVSITSSGSGQWN